MMPCDAYTGTSILIIIFIIINNISVEFFKEKRLNKIFKNKFSSKITRYTIYSALKYLHYIGSYFKNNMHYY